MLPQRPVWSRSWSPSPPAPAAVPPCHGASAPRDAAARSGSAKASHSPHITQAASRTRLLLHDSRRVDRSTRTGNVPRFNWQRTRRHRDAQIEGGKATPFSCSCAPCCYSYKATTTPSKGKQRPSIVAACSSSCTPFLALAPFQLWVPTPRLQRQQIPFSHHHGVYYKSSGIFLFLFLAR